MSPLQQKPILHGRDHCPGGADPIPCMISGPSGDFETVVLATSDLYAYWRLGETGEPWADTSGVAPNADLSEEDSGTALTPDVTGALASGDDGAVEFNFEGTALNGGRYLQSDGIKSFNEISDNAGEEMSVCAWIKQKETTAVTRGGIVGAYGAASSGGGFDIGWGLQIMYDALTVRFTRGDSGASGTEKYATTVGAIDTDTWYFFVGTYDGADIKLYANAVLVDTTADPSRGTDATDDVVRLGYTLFNQMGVAIHGWFYGTIDEAAVWTRALTQAEINALYNAGVGSEGGAAAGYVLTTDGSGGTVWAAPTIEVEF